MTEKEARDLLEAPALSDYALIVRNFAVAMTFYRTEIGDDAMEQIRNRIGSERVSAIAFLVGFSAGAGMRTERWEDLARGMAICDLKILPSS